MAQMTGLCNGVIRNDHYILLWINSHPEDFGTSGLLACILEQLFLFLDAASSRILACFGEWPLFLIDRMGVRCG